MVRTRKSRNSRAIPKHLLRMINRADLGHQLRRGPDPPVITIMPWWPITIDIAISEKTSLNAVEILKLVAAQVGFPKTDAALIRIDSLRFWSSEPCQLNVFGLVGEGNLCSLSDRPTKVNFAHVGWKFGNTHRNVVFSGKASEAQYENIATAIGKGVLRVHCYFRIGGVEIADKESPLNDLFAQLNVSH